MTKQELLHELESTIRNEIKNCIIANNRDATNTCYTFCRIVTQLDLLNAEESYPEFLNDAYKRKNEICNEYKIKDDLSIVIYDASKEK